MTETVIRGATLIDGSGSPPRVADVGFAGDRITRVGLGLRGDAEIDGAGLHVLPGFVDLHTHYDAQITWDPEVSPSADHGVTTIVMGNCGVGFAPARPDEHEWLIGLMEGVEDIPGSALAEGLRWEWSTFPEYLDALARKERAVDFATQVPHGPVRAWVMGERGAADEPATAQDREAMARIVAEGTAAGALGFSTSRTPLHKARDGRFVPGTSAAEVELAEIAAALPRGGVLQLAAHHPRVPDELDWMERIAARGVSVLFNLVQTDEAPELWRDVLARVDRAPAGLTAQVAARPAGILMAWQGSAHPFLPVLPYLEHHQKPWEERRAALSDPAVRARIVGQDPMSVGPFEDMVVNSFHRMFRLGDPPDYEPTADRSAAAVAAREGRSPREVVYDWLQEDEGRGVVYFPLFNYSHGHTDHLTGLLAHPRTVVGLGDGGAHCGAICDASTPTWLLSWWARDRARGALPVERLVAAQTRRNAVAYGLRDRGLVAPGFRADLLLVDLARVGLEAPRLAWDLPAGGRRWVQGSRGYARVWVGGVCTRRDGVATGALPGRLVRGAR